MSIPIPPLSGELAGGRGGPIDQGRDLLEGQVEQVVRHEGEPLGRGERIEHHEQSQADRVGENRLIGRVGTSLLTNGSGMCMPAGSSGRAARERSRLRQTRATTVVSHPPGFCTSSGPEPLRRSQASWSASSASAWEPSIR
jgi:hypothetical protein